MKLQNTQRQLLELEREVNEIESILAVPIPARLEGDSRAEMVSNRIDLRVKRREYLREMDYLLGGSYARA